MSKVIVVSKTHMDLGYTDYASVIRRKYIDEFIPAAVKIAAALNKNGDKKFVWTTGAWILKEALNDSEESGRIALVEAVKRGDIAPHAMPFTTHTELLDFDTLDYGLSIVEEIDRISGRKTIAAKLTDVPGHTVGIVPILAKHGVKLLHIGVNGASALPNVPPCFLWKRGKSEVVVIYSGDYGGGFSCDLTDDVLFFDHTYDNQGSNGEKAVLDRLKNLKKRYPNHEVVAGRLDDYAEIIWEKRERLPIITDEIGDTWIHGAAADPYKAGAIRELIALKNAWLKEGSLKRESAAYRTLADNLLCLAEHTCGMDIKSNLGDFTHYLRKDFERAKSMDTVKHGLRELFLEFPIGLIEGWFRLFKVRKRQGSYSAVEKSWQEQRAYIAEAIAGLNAEQKAEAEKGLKTLLPVKLPVQERQTPLNDMESLKEYAFGKWAFTVDNRRKTADSDTDFGISVSYEGRALFRGGAPLLYRGYNATDYNVWIQNYTRDLKKTYLWALGDFSRPNLKYVEGKYPSGDFYYEPARIGGGLEGGAFVLSVVLKAKEIAHRELGAPETAEIVYTFYPDRLKIEVTWLNKPKNRLTEAILFRLFPAFTDGALKYSKSGSVINAEEIAENGGRNLSAVENATLNTEAGTFIFVNRHAPLLARGDGNFLHFEKTKFRDIFKDGISFILHNNVWGTNFPLWYGDNAYFEFEIKPVISD
ncbi:MAG: DUF5054 domain-containing protein [Clostridiales bacterium]|jgi:hypothetical protein|nr:DUF5054 domain-containing protein [Clostridiales bacterium]